MAKVAFIGLGVMGAPIARHLAAAGHDVTVYNRTAEKAATWVAEHGGKCAATPADAAAGQDAVLTCVGNDDDLAAVTLGNDGAFGAMRAGAVFIDHTTVSADIARQLADEASQRGLLAVDAPVSGGQAGAENGKLSIMCGGSAEAMALAEPLMQAYAARIVHIGGPGAGQTTKMVNQIAIAGVLQGVSEALRFAQASELDLDRVLEAISGGAAQSWQMVNRWPTMARDEFDFGFAIDWMRKDLGLALDEAGRNGALLPMTALVDQFYAEVQKMGGARQDTERAGEEIAAVKKSMMGSFRTLIGAATALALVATPALADGLIDNVNGMTMDAKGQVIHFTGIVIGRDGKVVKLLQSGDKRPERPDWLSNEKGRTLLPGFIDAHGHVLDLGFRALELDLSGTKSLDEAKTKIAAYVAANPEKKWIVGGGWNQEKWGLGRFPTAADLDSVVGDRPVWLGRADGHAAWANSAAIKAAGVTAKTATPAGGRIEKAGVEPAGVFVDAAMSLIAKAVPQPLPKERDFALQKAQEILLAFGITATADMGTSMDDWLAMRRMGDRGGLQVRIMSYGAGVETAIRVGGSGPTPWLYGDRLRMGGVKLYADGALGSRGAWLLQPYKDAAGQSGAGFMTDTLLQNYMSRASMDGWQVAVHAIGDKANRQVLDAIEAMSATYKGDRRWRIEHAQIVDPTDLPRFASLKVIASMQPTHATSDRTMAEARLGPERLTGAYAWATMLRNGVPLAFGSDYPVESPDPWAGWAAGFTRQDANGEPFGGWRPEEKVTREQAWWAFTQGAAYAGFAEEKFGRLAPGQAADFIIVDRDPFLSSPTDLRATKVEETWIGGQKVYVRKVGALPNIQSVMLNLFQHPCAYLASGRSPGHGGSHGP